MTTHEKQQTIEAANAFMQSKGLSVNDLAKFSKVNIAYLSQMLRGIETTSAGGGKTVAIQDKYYRMLAKSIEFKYQKDYWKTIATPQFLQIISSLQTAKESWMSAMLIGDTGCGKTFAVDKFINKHPKHTYRITVSKLHTLPFILEKILQALGLHEKGSAAAKLERIILHLQKLRNEGENVIIIIDEAENMRMPVFGFVKALYDGIREYCSIVLIGTTELTDKMDRLKRKNKDGMPQFCRRFKAGTVFVANIEQENYTTFFNEMGVTDKGLQKLLCRIAENFAELHDYLMPALREADERGVPLTEEFFRIKYNMPK